MGKGVARRRKCDPDTPEQAGMMAQSVTDIIETNGMGELRVEQRHHVTPRGERPRLGFDPVLAGQLGDQVAWNQVANLRENAELRFGGWLFVFHNTDPKWDRPPATTFFTQAMGWLWMSFISA